MTKTESILLAGKSPPENSSPRRVRSSGTCPRSPSPRWPTAAPAPTRTTRPKTWAMVEKVYDLINGRVVLPDGTPVRVVVAPEIVYGARTGALAQEYYTREGVSANIWVSRSWAYSDELMSACQGIGSSEWQQAAYGLNQTDRPGRRVAQGLHRRHGREEAAHLLHLQSRTWKTKPGRSPPTWPSGCCASPAAPRRSPRCAARTTSPSAACPWASSAPTSAATCSCTTSAWARCPYDMVGVKGRMDTGLYDHEELETAFAFMKTKFTFDFGEGDAPHAAGRAAAGMPEDDPDRARPDGRQPAAGRMPRVGKAQGFQADVEHAQGCNAIAAGHAGPAAVDRPVPELRHGRIAAQQLVRLERLPRAHDRGHGERLQERHRHAAGPPAYRRAAALRRHPDELDAREHPGRHGQSTSATIAPQGLIDKRNSGAGALDYAVDVFELVKGGRDMDIVQRRRRSDPRAASACSNS